METVSTRVDDILPTSARRNIPAIWSCDESIVITISCHSYNTQEVQLVQENNVVSNQLVSMAIMAGLCGVHRLSCRVFESCSKWWTHVKWWIQVPHTVKQQTTPRMKQKKERENQIKCMQNHKYMKNEAAYTLKTSHVAEFLTVILLS